MTIPKSIALAACAAWWTLAANAQPLAKPLADFDRMVAELKTSTVVGEPIRAGDTAVIPFAAVHFGMGSAGVMTGFAGGMGAKTVPLGVLIVEGDDVRVELLPQREEKPSAMMQLMQAIIDHKVTFMTNGVNLGNAPGNVADLTSIMNGMMGQTTVMVNGLNLGNLKAPVQPPADADKAIADLEAAARRNPTAENYFRLGEALRKSGRKDKAAAAYRKAIELRPGYAEAIKALEQVKE